MRPTPERRDSRAATPDPALDISGTTAVTSGFHDEEAEDVLNRVRRGKSHLNQASRAAQRGAAPSGNVGARATAQVMSGFKRVRLGLTITKLDGDFTL
jgi:hypothetical protein